LRLQLAESPEESIFKNCFRHYKTDRVSIINDLQNQEAVFRLFP
jgi:hypothetical protein